MFIINWSDVRFRWLPTLLIIRPEPGDNFRLWDVCWLWFQISLLNVDAANGYTSKLNAKVWPPVSNR